MLRVLIIDNDTVAVELIEQALVNCGDIGPCNVVTDPVQALRDLESLEPELIFLETEWSRGNRSGKPGALQPTNETGGAALIAAIRQSCPQARLIVTASSGAHALEAFTYQVLDYILKPLELPRLERAVNIAVQQSRDDAAGARFSIRCLGGFEVGWENQAPIHWRSEKTRELFACLVHFRGLTLSRDQIIELLWPDLEPDKAAHLLYNGIYYIRKTLAQARIERRQILIDNNYRLTLDGITVDSDAFLPDARRKYKVMRLDQLTRIESLYRGPYLDGTDWKWAENLRYEVENNYRQLLLSLAERYEQTGAWTELEQVLLKAYAHNPFDEIGTVRLLRLYHKLNHRYAAIRHYQAYCRLLREEFDDEPSAEVDACLHAILAATSD
jgi:two-component SAPR family response regulator